MNKLKKVSIKTIECQRCGHKWVPRKSPVLMCPACRSALWNFQKDQRGKGVAALATK